jgi:hypothetical protein
LAHESASLEHPRHFAPDLGFSTQSRPPAGNEDHLESGRYEPRSKIPIGLSEQSLGAIPLASIPNTLAGNEPHPAALSRGHEKMCPKGLSSQQPPISNDPAVFKLASDSLMAPQASLTRQALSFPVSCAAAVSSVPTSSSNVSGSRGYASASCCAVDKFFSPEFSPEAVLNSWDSK